MNVLQHSLHSFSFLVLYNNKLNKYRNPVILTNNDVKTLFKIKNEESRDFSEEI